MLADLLFLMFAAILTIAALGVISARNPMYCVLFMILAFFNAAGLFLLLGAEFLGLLLVMVYVGAIAVMFLFVLMTIDIDFAVLKQGFAAYLPVGLLVAGLLAIELVAAAMAGGFAPARPPVSEAPENIVQLGHVLFTEYFLAFQGAGMILLVAMMGAIVLTHRRREGVRRQNINRQIRRTRGESMTLTTPETGAGATAEHFEGRKVD
jgi:NADH-quinone oxidoreductase subunit J